MPTATAPTNIELTYGLLCLPCTLVNFDGAPPSLARLKRILEAARFVPTFETMRLLTASRTVTTASAADTLAASCTWDAGATEVGGVG